MPTHPAPAQPPHAVHNPEANRLGIDYRAAADSGPLLARHNDSSRPAHQRLPVPIVDVHTHINGTEAARVYREVIDLYGVRQVWTMTQLEHAEEIRRILGENSPEGVGGRTRFIAVPNYFSADRAKAMTTGFLERIHGFAAIGSRICKFWAAPRSRDFTRELGLEELAPFDNPWRRRHMDAAKECGMMFMTHIADPDTWFATKYADATRYGTKADQYIDFERLLDHYADIPWMCAHMGGWPEDLEFLTGLLDRHPNLVLDTSATKWMVRELSKHPRDRFIAFLERFRGRILFGSDIVTMEVHVAPPADAADGEGESRPGPAGLARSRQQAFELYASRYWALRTLFETDYEGESPIVDPDLHMIAPDRYSPTAAPTLAGKSVPRELLQWVYRDAALQTIEKWHLEHA